MSIPLDRETLIARFDGIRQFAQGGRRAPHKPLLLLYALARLKHDRQTEGWRFNATEAVLRPLLRTYGPWGSQPRVSGPTVGCWAPAAPWRPVGAATGCRAGEERDSQRSSIASWWPQSGRSSPHRRGWRAATLRAGCSLAEAVVAKLQRPAVLVDDLAHPVRQALGHVGLDLQGDAHAGARHGGEV
jgi:hypothetical protein